MIDVPSAVRCPKQTIWLLSAFDKALLVRIVASQLDFQANKTLLTAYIIKISTCSLYALGSETYAAKVRGINLFLQSSCKFSLYII